VGQAPLERKAKCQSKTLLAATKDYSRQGYIDRYSTRGQQRRRRRDQPGVE
jgi:hypothetical protein